MKKLWLLLLLLISNSGFAQIQITHASLVGVWTYFYITQDDFSTDKVIVSQQRLIIRDGQNATLIITARDEEYVQETSYNLKYSLSLHDNTPYLSLFSTESDVVLGAYMRMPVECALEMASDPNFRVQKQLYKRVGPSANQNTIEEFPKNSILLN
ncbi:MAG: hypothetical protein ACRCTQ_01195 [Brevinemataceae bacterium]